MDDFSDGALVRRYQHLQIELEKQMTFIKYAGVF